MNKTAQLLPHSTPAQKRRLFEEYVLLHKYIHWCYVAAVPLTNYCEKKLRQQSPELLAIARPWKKLDVDKLGDSLRKLKQSPPAKQSTLISRHLHTYAWIKTAYNIVGTYTEQDVLEELKHLNPKKKSITARGNNPFLTGLRIGMYARNRMKELSQYIWFAVEPLGQTLADDLHITRDDFFRLLPSEVSASLKLGRLSLTQDAQEERKRDYLVGCLRGEPVLITGAVAKKLYDELQAKDASGITHVQGAAACRGNVSGKVRVVRNQADFSQFKTGEILVTSMTTPDFVVIMKKAGGIVTDEGGLSCHAAIVSRELGIPCVIGTKVATTVFKNGDMVEVDANKGVVKKL